MEPFRITDHAVLRYMERAMGLNVEAVREHIDSVCRGAAGIGASCLRSEGVRFEIVNNAVISVVPDTGSPNHTTRARNQRAIERAKAYAT